MAGTDKAAIVTVGSELVEGLRIDTNTAYIARRLARVGFSVVETVSIGDDADVLAATLARLAATCRLVITTGGLGPTHDDVTRDAAAAALGIDLRPDAKIEAWLGGIAQRHEDPASRLAVFTQALVLTDAEVLWPARGTAPGQVVSTPAGDLVLLPGPPSEMSEMLERALSRYDAVTAEPLELGVVGMAESDVQHAAQRALADREDIVLTVLAKPGDTRVVLMDAGAGTDGLAQAALAVAEEIGSACYSLDGHTLAEETVAVLTARGITLATAESCTGGLVSAALTDVPGSSEVFLGGVVSYSNEVKIDVLGVPEGVVAEFGAVSGECAAAMAQGARERLNADVAVAVTGVAGPGGGTAEKPVGLVWFAIADSQGSATFSRNFVTGSRESIRARATATALDLVRRHVLGG